MYTSLNIVSNYWLICNNCHQFSSFLSSFNVECLVLFLSPLAKPIEYTTLIYPLICPHKINSLIVYENELSFCKFVYVEQ